MAKIEIEVPNAFLPAVCEAIGERTANNDNARVAAIRKYIRDSMRALYVEGARRIRDNVSLTEAINIA